MAGYRNRLVHGYAEVSAEEMYSLISTRLTEFEAYCFHILQYLEKLNKNGQPIQD